MGFLPAFAVADSPNGSTNYRNARPGTLNYVEGKVSLDGQALDAKSIGSTEIDPGQVLTTDNGKAEILLTPGVFLRLGSDSSVRMVDSGSPETRL